MLEIEYEAPGSIDEAVRLLTSGDIPSRVFAGGTDLLVQMRSVPPRAERLVDIKRVPELSTLALDASGLRLGAAVSCWEITQHKGMREAYPGLVEAAELIGSMQIQNRASLGGNLCNGSPAADSVPALIAVGAQCSIAGPDGTRSVAVEDFIRGPGETVLERGEILVEYRIPPPPPGSADAYLRFIPRGEMDIAVVGAAVCVTLDQRGTCTGARVALAAVAATPLRVDAAAAALVSTQIDDAALDRAGAAASDASDPIDDKRGTAVYRRKLASVLTRRAARCAAERARERRS